MLGPDFGSNHGSFSDVAGVSFRIEKSAPRRIMRSAPKYREIGFSGNSWIWEIGWMSGKSRLYGHVGTSQKYGFGNDSLPEMFLGPLLSDLGTDLGTSHIPLRHSTR